MQPFQTFFYEKYVVGLIENITLKDLGVISAKIDSGNGAYNVLHGEDIEMDTKNKVVRFITVNKISVEKDLIETITINLGAGNMEKRPVVEFDVKVGNRIFKKVRFSIGNRSSNEHKVLVGKDFIENELDALIDVSLKNVAPKGIEVDV